MPLLLLLVAAAAGLWAWDARQRLAVAERSSGEWQQVVEELRGRLLEVDRELQAARDRQRGIDGRLTDTASNQRVLREETLAIGERAALLEDALVKLAQTRQEGRQAMLLDEAEFLLLTGGERLGLFRDAAAAIRAFTLADAALAGLQDPIYAPLRHTLAQEVRLLRELPADPLPLARNRVNALIAELPNLPTEADVAAAEPAQSRLIGLLGQLVTVRRLDDGGAPLDPLLLGARRSTLALRLQLGLASLERGEHAAWSEALQVAQRDLRGLYDAEQPQVAAQLQALAGLQAATPTPLPTLGATLAELRGLRATRRLSAIDTPPLAAPAAPAAEASSQPLPAVPATSSSARSADVEAAEPAKATETLPEAQQTPVEAPAEPPVDVE